MLKELSKIMTRDCYLKENKFQIKDMAILNQDNFNEKELLLIYSIGQCIEGKKIQYLNNPPISKQNILPFHKGHIESNETYLYKKTHFLNDNEYHYKKIDNVDFYLSRLNEPLIQVDPKEAVKRHSNFEKITVKFIVQINQDEMMYMLDPKYNKTYFNTINIYFGIPTPIGLSDSHGIPLYVTNVLDSKQNIRAGKQGMNIENYYSF